MLELPPVNNLKRASLRNREERFDLPSSPGLFFATSNPANKRITQSYAQKSLSTEQAYLRLISPLGELDDLSIVDYLTISSKRNSKAKIEILDPTYVGKEGITENFWNTLLATTQRKDGLAERLRSANQILCPIARNGHWYLLSISRARENNSIIVRCLDGKNCFAEHIFMFDVARQLITNLFADDNRKLDMRSVTIPKQNNSYDCGVVVSFYGGLLCRQPNLFDQYDLPNEEAHYANFRPVMAKVLDQSTQGQLVSQKQRLTRSQPLSQGPTLFEFASTPTRLKVF